MPDGLVSVPLEHLNPHDLVTYSRCPHEMELARARHLSMLHGNVVVARTPLGVVPLHHSPLLPPPTAGVKVVEGRLDVFTGDTLVYEDEGEDELPVLFPPEHVHIDPAFHGHGSTLIDPELEIAGRPDLIVRRADGSLFPIEYKSTHLFVGYHEAHGRTFDVIQAIAECRLVHATSGVRPKHGIILYGDAAGSGEREGFVEVPYGDAEEHWLRYALKQVRSDPERAPVPSERTCTSCEPNRDGLCRYASVGFNGTHLHGR